MLPNFPKLKTLSLANLPQLFPLDVDRNMPELSHLSLSNLSKVRDINFDGNKVETLHISNLRHLQTMQITDLPLKNLEFSDLPSLFDINLMENELTLPTINELLRNISWRQKK